MQTNLTRRSFLTLSGTVSVAGVLAASAEPTLIEFLGSPGMDVHLEEEYTKFKEENPGLEWIQVQQQQGIQLLTAIASGTAPDTARVESNVYRTFVREEQLEVAGGTGNISLYEGQPLVHVHAVFADSTGRTIGGHINPGTTVFAMEATIQQLVGDPPEFWGTL